MSNRPEPAYSWTVSLGKRYWPQGQELILAPTVPLTDLPPSYQDILIPLPEWASDLGVNGHLLVDASCLLPGEGAPWVRCDWWTAAFLYASSALEWHHEQESGPIHSYASKLGRQHPLRFRHAWTNRILLFLRRTAARHFGQEETALFGPLPSPVIALAHDVDAITKRPEIRLKQSAFHIFNSLKFASNGQLKPAAGKFYQALSFMFSRADYWRIPEIMALEDQAGLRSTFYFYAGPAGTDRSLRCRILDPAYDICTDKLHRQIDILKMENWKIGLHPSFDSYADADSISEQKQRLESILDQDVHHVRQHWLRFSLSDTWSCQTKAGLKLDSTFGFNDTPGFRNNCAIQFTPWDNLRNKPHEISIIPTVFMDSHFYDYEPMDDGTRREEMVYWLQEVRDVHGEIGVNWHQRVLSSDYGWGSGFHTLISLLA